MTQKLNKEERLNSINAILDKEVKPVLANDGGGLTVVGLTDENILQIHYEGACGGCPSATMGTLRFIQETLRQRFDPELKVEAV